MRSERGFITVDFLFAFVLVLSFSALLFALTLTLTVAEITQYITFSAARNYYAAHQDEAEQEMLARQKFSQLVDNKVLSPLYKNGWFIIDKTLEQGTNIKDLSVAYKDYAESAGDPNTFWGVGTSFTAKILDFNVPFYGSTNDGNTGGFKTFIASYLGREPTASECYNFNTQRWASIRALDTGGAAPYSTGTDPTKYVVVTDNGC